MKYLSPAQRKMMKDLPNKITAYIYEALHRLLTLLPALSQSEPMTNFSRWLVGAMKASRSKETCFKQYQPG